MKIRRILSLVLVVIMIVALVGCGGKKRTPIKLTLSTEDAEAILAAAGIMLPDAEVAAGAGTVVTWYSNWDFHNYSEGEMINTGFFTFTEKYGCESEWIEFPSWAERYTQLANLVLAGSSPDFMPASTDLFPMKALKGMIVPVNDYIDYDDPLFADMKDYVQKYFSIGEMHYFMVTDMTFDLVCPYNRRTIDEWGFDDPAELYWNDEWTWDVFSDMCMDFTDSDANRYALDGWYFGRAIMHSSGVPTVGYDTELGKFVSNVDDPRLERAAQVLYDLNKAEVVFPWWNGWQLRNGTDGGGMKEGDCLFQPIGSWGFTGPVDTISAVWGDVEGHELMFVPMPRDPSGDGIYYQDITSTGYALIAGAKNPDGVALLAMCDRFKIIDPTVVGIDRYQKEHTYLWTEEMLDMYDECYRLANSGVDNVILTYGVDADAGYGSAIGSRILSFDDNAHSTSAAGAQTWGQLKESLGDSLQFAIDELNDKVAAFEANGYRAEASMGND